MTAVYEVSIARESASREKVNNKFRDFRKDTFRYILNIKYLYRSEINDIIKSYKN